MGKYSEAFIELVDLACKQTKEFNINAENHTVPNPHYIGKGNPNAKILIVGKELAFDIRIEKQLRDESIENPAQWNTIIETGRDYKCEKGFNPLYPYKGYIPSRAGATWNKYQRLFLHLSEDFHVVPNGNFHRNFFYTELNATPSKLSPGANKIDSKLDRMKLFKENSFFKAFDIVILALGNYLTSAEIKETFNVSEADKSLTAPNEKLIIYSNPETHRLVIHTRQLSMTASNSLLKKIADTINMRINI